MMKSFIQTTVHFARRNKLLFLLMSVLLALAAVFRPVIIELLTKAFYVSNSVLIDYRYYNNEILKYNGILMHYLIVLPALSLAGLLYAVIKFKGAGRVFAFLLRFLKSFLVLIAIVLLYINPLQFLIIVLPVASSFIFVTNFTNISDLIFKINAVFAGVCLQVVLVGEILSLFKQLNMWGYLGGLSIIFFILLFKAGGSVARFKKDISAFDNGRQKVCGLVESDKWLGLLACFLLAGLIFRVAVVLYVPPNTSDGMHYHLSRVGYWLSQGSFDAFYTHNIRQSVFPINSSVLFLWLMVAVKNDVLCGFIQLISYLLTGSLMYKLFSLLLKEDFKTSFGAVCLWLSLPLLVIQNITVQNDLFVCHFILLSILSLLSVKRIEGRMLELSAVSLAFAVGVKSIAFIALILMLIGFVGLLKIKWLNFKDIKKWILCFLFSLLLFSSYIYIQNYFVYGMPLGPQGVVAYHQSIHAGIASMASVIAQNAFVMITNQTGMNVYLGPLSILYTKITAVVGEALFHLLRIPINYAGTVGYSEKPYKFNFYSPEQQFVTYDSMAFYGGVGAVVFLSVIAGCFLFFKKRKNKALYKKERVITWMAVFSLSYFIAVSLIKKWDPWMGRHFLLTVFFGFPVLMFFLRKHNRIFKILLIYSVFSLVPTVLMDSQKPLVPYRHEYFTMPVYGDKQWEGDKFLWVLLKPLRMNRDRIGLRCMLRPYTEVYVRDVELIVPSSATLGVVLLEYQWDYPLFGSDLKRRVIPVNFENLREKNPDYLLVNVLKLQREKYLSKLINSHYTLVTDLGVDLPNKEMYIYKRNTL